MHWGFSICLSFLFALIPAIILGDTSASTQKTFLTEHPDCWVADFFSKPGTLVSFPVLTCLHQSRAITVLHFICKILSSSVHLYSNFSFSQLSYFISPVGLYSCGFTPVVFVLLSQCISDSLLLLFSLSSLAHVVHHPLAAASTSISFCLTYPLEIMIFSKPNYMLEKNNRCSLIILHIYPI